jgi:hypothetical protein
MNFGAERVAVELAYRESIAIEDAKGAQIDCRYGMVWITESGGGDDVVVGAGQSYEISRGGTAVVQALRPAVVVFRLAAAGRAGSRPMWQPAFGARTLA